MRDHTVLATLAILHRLRKLVDEGRNAREIEAALGIPRRRVHRIARRHGIELPRGIGDNARCLRVPLPLPVVATLDTVAAGAAVDRVEMVRRILAIALEGDGKAAIRLLGPQARPKRAYGRPKTPTIGKRELKAARAVQEAERARAKAEAATEALARMPTAVKDAIAAGQHPLRAVRLHLGLRQVDVAERAGMGEYGDTRVGELERSSRALTPRMAERLAKAMGVEMAWLDPITGPNPTISASRQPEGDRPTVVRITSQ